MKKPISKRTALVKPSLNSGQDERTRAHRAVNWVVSVILIAFAIWSIQLNAEGRGMLKQTTTAIQNTDVKIDHLTTELAVVKGLCQTAPIVIPTPTTDTQKTP